MLRHIYSLQGDRFNVKAYARLTGVGRSTIYDLLHSLKNKGFVALSGIANWQITAGGVAFIEATEGVSGTPGEGVGRQCRVSRREKVSEGVSGALSVHYLNYKVPLKGSEVFSEQAFDKLGVKWRKVALPNFTQYLFYFDGVTVVLNKKSLFVRVHDLIGSSVEETELEALKRVTAVLDKLSSLGVAGDSILLSGAHYARVNSVLGEVLRGVDGKLSVDLGEGKRFWIDHSTGLVEDETDDRDLRVKLDQLILDVGASDSRFSDLDKMREVLGLLVKLQVVPPPQPAISPPAPGGVSYIG